MKFTAKQIADLLQGTVEGDPQASVQTFAKIDLPVIIINIFQKK